MPRFDRRERRLASKASGFCRAWAVLSIALAAGSTTAQQLPASPLFAPPTACGPAGVVYQPAGTFFRLTYSTPEPVAEYPRFRFHSDGTQRGVSDGLDGLPVQLGNARTFEVGPGKTVDVPLNGTQALFGRLRAYDDLGHESVPVPLSLVPLGAPAALQVTTGTPNSLSWTAPSVLPGTGATVSYQVYRFACTELTPCGATDTFLGESGPTSLQDTAPAGQQVRYAVRTVARFQDDSPAIVSQPAVSACSCPTQEVTQSVGGLEGLENGQAKFTIGQPVVGNATLTVTGTLCWVPDNCGTFPGIEVGPYGAGVAICPQSVTDCDNDPDTTRSHAAFFYHVGASGPKVFPSGATQATATFQLSGLQPQNQIFLKVNDGAPENNSGGFTATLRYTSQPVCPP